MKIKDVLIEYVSNVLQQIDSEGCSTDHKAHNIMRKS